MDVSSMSDEELLQIALESEETEMYARENTRATGNPPIDKEALAHIRALILAAHPARRRSEVVDAERLSPLAKISTGLERR